MKKILLLTSAVSLIATSGCLVSDGRYDEHYHGEHHYEHHEEVVVVHTPAIVVRPPEIIVR